jgi:enoyl-CoA hydratase/carnithine racemase
MSITKMGAERRVRRVKTGTLNALDVATKEAIGKAFVELDEHRKDIRVVILNC